VLALAAVEGGGAGGVARGCEGVGTRTGEGEREIGRERVRSGGDIRRNERNGDSGEGGEVARERTGDGDERKKVTEGRRASGSLLITEGG